MIHFCSDEVVAIAEGTAAVALWYRWGHAWAASLVRRLIGKP